MKYFSVKKNVIWVVSIFILFTVIFVLLSSKNSLYFEKTSENFAEVEFGLLANKDSDGDGLRDWEEALWKTDINNPDTDGDGTNDGQETRTGRDPTKPAPDDILDTETQREITNQDGINYVPPTTATEIFAENFFKEYIALKKRGDGKVTEESKALFVKSVMDSVPFEKSIVPVIHTINELKILRTSTESEEIIILKKYGNSLAQIFIDSLENTVENEIDIITEIFSEETGEDESEEIIKRMDIVILSYKNINRKLIALETPESVSTLHLDMINTYEKIIVSLEGMSRFFTDTLRSLAGISYYSNSVEQLRNNGTALNNFFSEKKVIFNENEIGIIFFNDKNQII